MEFVLLVNVLLMVAELVAVVVSPPTSVLLVATHEKDEVMLDVSAILRAVPLQIAAVLVLVTTGVGWTVTLTVWLAPTQLPVVDVGVTV
jgi:hypothetical protein